MGNDKFILDEEFKNLLPPLNPEDFENLERSILRDGCRDPLVLWLEARILIDGYHRHEICTKHGLPFRIEKKSFKNRDEALDWMIENQRIRRNMNRFQWGEVILKRRESIAAKAKANQKAGGGAVRTKTYQPVKTFKELAKMARMGSTTLRQVAFILKHADQKTIAKLRKGDPNYSINGVSEELHELLDKKQTKKSVVPKSKRRNKPAPPSEPPQDLSGHVDLVIATIEDIAENLSVEDRLEFYNKLDKWISKIRGELVLSVMK
jgi:hypothetical protein